MLHGRLRVLIVIGALAGALVGVCGRSSAQQPSEAEKTPAADAASDAAAVAAARTADLRKKAAQHGYRTRVKNGVATFCRSGATLGSRFVTEKCMNEDQFALTLLREDQQRDQLRLTGACGGIVCGGMK